MNHRLMGRTADFDSANEGSSPSGSSNKERHMWRLWCKALGDKATNCSKESDIVAYIRTAILAAYLITNAVIVAGVVRHWNDGQPTEYIYGQ